VSILGYSWGEVLSAIYASLDGAGEERRDIKNLVLQSAHIDFDRDDSILACWFRRLPIDEIVRGLDGGTAAVVDGRFINMALLMRNPAVHFQDALRFAACMGGGNGGGRQQGEEALQLWSDAARIAAWLSDSPVLPTPFFEAFIRNLYQQNQLVRKRLEVTGWGGQDAAARTADLQRITVPLLNVVGDFDDICPPAASLPVMELASSRDKQQIRFPEGHIELCVSAHAHRELWPQVVEWLRSRD
jgi:polyhydroxyalkanoate synthase